ncbi:MAG TPA: MxaD family protein [Cytophagales bacterium]|nr:MxaD family protein [Cytophagales bacterium]HAA22985.1 MxaD family protein [Cytophagales bacterium]HAP57975.1 MxaD family protein [Cytophagales bacterium]
MDIQKSITVNKPIAAVWEILGNQYTEAYRWARELYHSEGSGAPQFSGASCSKRTCDTSFGTIHEEIRTFDPQRHILEYEVVKGFPGFIKQGINHWELTSLSDGITKVTMHFKGETQGLLGLVMGPVLNRKLNKNLGEVLGDFKHYVETGKPSPGKVKDNQKHARRVA